MPNYCSYFIKAKGPDKDLESLEELLTADYSYISAENFMKYSFVPRDTEEKRKIAGIIEDWVTSELSGKTLSGKDMKIFSEEVIEYFEKNKNIKDSDAWPPFKELMEKLGDAELKEGFINPPEEEHLFRIFGVYPEMTEDGLYIDGTCAWSVSTCMMPDYPSYYSDYKEDMKLPDNIAKGSNMVLWAAKHPETEFEIISYEEGGAFFEHYLFRDGVMETGESDDMDRLYIEDMDDLEETLDDNTLSYDRRKRCEAYMEHCRAVMKELPGEKESLFPVFMSLGEPDYIEIPDDFNENGTYEPLFSI